MRKYICITYYKLCKAICIFIKLTKKKIYLIKYFYIMHNKPYNITCMY